MNLTIYKKTIVGILILGIIVTVSLFYFYRQDDQDTLFLATTTSVENSGLLDLLIEEFKDQTGVVVKVTAVGSGAAADLARNGDVDGVIIHAPELEADLINEGIGINHTTLWYNYFVILGPESDPADVASATNVTEAFSRIFNAGQNGATTFYSRGDSSGTHIKELMIWEQAGLDTTASTNSWYFEASAGMSATIRVASENDGYTLSDLGTFAQLNANNEDITLTDLFNKEDTIMYNPYSYLAVNPDVYDDTHYDLALRFLEFLLDEDTINLVSNYKVGNIILFNPISS